jgi:HlyD family secretion protein
MSAIFNPSLLQTAEKAAPALAPAPAKPPSRKKWRIVAAVVLGVAAIAYLLWPATAKKPSVQTTVRTAKVAVGSFERVLRLTGNTAARNFASITAPMMRGPDSGRNLVLIKLAAAGSIVKKGDLVADIDAQPLRDHVDDLDSDVRQANADVKKRKAEQSIELENLKQTLRTAQATWDKAKLDSNAAEIRTAIDKELLQLGVDEAEAQYNELKNEISETEAKNRAEIKVLEYTSVRHARHRDRHKNDIEKFTMRAPIGGLVVMQTLWRQGDMGQVQQGDQVSPGQPFMKIVDTSSMQVEARVNQVESEGLRIGHKARINFDAFPTLQLNGKVHNVGAMGVGGWREQYYLRTIPVVISIEGADNRVIPDLSASADVVLEQKENALVAPLDAVLSEGGKHVVYTRQGDRFLSREVRIGGRNNTQVEILAGLNAGDEIALGHPASQP